mgnify:CR=1 FL=1
MNLRIYYKYLSSRIASKWTVLLVDVIIVVISMLSACFLQYRLSSVSYEISLYVWLTILAVLCNICFFHILRTYVGVIRFSSFVDIYRVFWSLTISCTVFRELLLVCFGAWRNFAEQHSVYSIYVHLLSDGLYAHCCEDAL